ncbi:MAG: cold shock domain-containing protein, partial [Pseudomonadota bacterium]
MQVKLSEQPDIRAGVLKWFDPVRGYGFLTLGEGQPDILLHADRLRASGLRALHEGSGIVARVEETGAGLRVVEILSVSEPTPPPAAPPAARPAGRLLPARVKWFERGRGYGFVRVFRIDEDVFVHNEVLRR